MKIKQSAIFSLIIMLLSLLASCTSDVKQASCSNQENFDPIFRQCVPKALGTSIQIESSSPTLSYSVNTTSTIPTLHSISVSDPFNQGYKVQWLRYQVGDQPNIVATDVETYQVVPSSLTPGTYNLEVLVKDFDNIRVLDKRTWSIVVNNLTPPSLGSASPAVASISYQTTDPLANFQIIVNNPDQLPGHRLDFFLDGVLVSQPSIPSNVNTIALSYGFNPGSVVAGNHSLEVFLRDSLNNTIGSYTWSITTVNPALPGFSLEIPTISNTITAIDGVTLSNNGFFITNTAGSLDITDICVEVDDYMGTAGVTGTSGTTVQFFSLNAPTGAKFPIHANPINFTANGSAGRRCLSTANGLYEIILANPQIGETKFIRAELRDTNVTDVNPADTRTWTVSARPKNEAPVITVVDPPSTTAVNVTQDAASPGTVFSFSVQDSDSNISAGIIAPEQFETTFLMTDFILNGSLVDAPQTLTYPDCHHLKNSGQSAAEKFGCNFTFPSWNSSGPVAPGPRVLTASVVDTPIAAWGGAPLPSNTISWSVNIIEAQTAPEVIDMPVSANSFEDPASGTAIDPVATGIIEGADVRVSFNVRDAQRDHFRYTISRCTAPASGCTPLITNATFTRTNGIQDAIVSIVDTTDQGIITSSNLVSGQNYGEVFYEISVTDIPDTAGTQLSAAPSTFSSKLLRIFNFNPAPVHVSGTEAPALTSPQNIFTGFPFTFSPGFINDASTTDGDVLEYQWQVKRASDPVANWRNINGATEANLTWTPPEINDGQTLEIRVCIGDNGIGNNVADCALNLVWNNISTISNLAASGDTSPTITTLNEFDSWFDESTRSLYTAHQYNSGGINRIKINKSFYGFTGAPSFASLDFHSYDNIGGGMNYEIQDLSITGGSDPTDSLRKSLYISYLALIPASPGFDKQLRVRRIDISDPNQIYFNYTGIQTFNTGAPTTPCFNTVTTTFPFVRTTITATQADCVPGDIIKINGVTFNVISPTLVNTSSGINVIEALNQAITVAAGTDPRLSSNGAPFHDIMTGVITVNHDQLKREYIDDTRSSIGLGQIMTSQSNWFVPSIDSPTGSKLLFYRGGLTGQLQAGAAGTNDACSTSSSHCQLLSSTSSDSILEFDSSMTRMSSPSTDSVYMSVRTVGNQVNVYRIPPTSPASITARINDLFPGDNIQNIKIAASKPNNNNIFIAGKNIAASEEPLSIIRIPVTTTLPASCANCDKQVSINDNNTNITKQLTDYQLVSSPIAGEAFLATISAASPSNGSLLIGSITGSPMQVNSNMTPIHNPTDSIFNISSKKSFVITDTVDPNITSTGFTIGQYTPTTSQNNRNVLFMSYFKTGGTNLNNPESAVININSEATMKLNVEENDLNTPPYFMRPYISN